MRHEVRRATSLVSAIMCLFASSAANASPVPVDPNAARLTRSPPRAVKPLPTFKSPREAQSQALEFGKKGLRGRAIEILNAAKKRYPKDAKIRWMLGILYRDTGRISKAERSFRKATTLDKSDAVAWSDLAAVLDRSGAQEEALRAADQALALSPRDAGMLADRAVIRFRAGQIDGAIRDGEMAVNIVDDDPHFQMDLALMYLTRGKNRDAQAALKLVEAAQTVLSREPWVALIAAQTLLAAGLTKRATAAFDALLSRNPRQAWASWGRGLIAWRAQKFKDARDFGRVAREVMPNTFRAKSHNRRQFFMRDAKAYLRWLDDELHHLSQPKNSQRSRRTGQAVLERLVVKGDCAHGPVRKALAALSGPIETCYEARAGQVDVTFSLRAGRATKVKRGEKGVRKDVDRCILGAVRAARFPDGQRCQVEASWERLRALRQGSTAAPSPAPTLMKPPLRPRGSTSALEPDATSSPADASP